jgi:alpha-amylase/alpha-mannosidase (GH57 family)
VHGHFYQPPRENPWTGIVEKEPTAAPFHDWNQRIASECYAPVANARVLGNDGNVEYRDNLYETMSFDIGPTLFEWMDTEAPAVYASILEADRASVLRLGHGNAVAMPYHHTILPLASKRDKITEVRWGIADFRRRFKREPEGVWLPETAVDEETLEVLADEAISFTILAPHQVANVDPKGLPLRYRARNGRDIALCIYDSELSADIAFGKLVKDGALLAAHLDPDDNRRLIAAAMDGETFGHHHRFGEMALARAFRFLEEHDGVTIENFASFLSKNPPELEATLVSPSSWSCTHGVERWRSNCGCRLATEDPPHQEWRAPLREALEWLANEIHTIYETEGSEIFTTDPWAIRDAYGDVIGASEAKVFTFIAGSITNRNDGARLERAAELLALEENALRMFTSCAWFFDDLARIETIQVMKYAAFAIELSGDAKRLENGFLDRLEGAVSIDPAEATARDIWLSKVKK